MPGDFHVLIVCTANRCRSPLAAALLSARARAAGLPWTVTSAGTHARPGEFTEPEVAEVLREIGEPFEPAPALAITEAAARGADLVLTAERAHRSLVLDLSPEQVARTFTILELARLLRATEPAGPVADPAELARLADSARARAGVMAAGDDLADPFRQPLEAFRECRSAVDHAVDGIVAAAVGFSPTR